jgi:hypothetical protein
MEPVGHDRIVRLSMRIEEDNLTTDLECSIHDALPFAARCRAGPATFVAF